MSSSWLRRCGTVGGTAVVGCLGMALAGSGAAAAKAPTGSHSTSRAPQARSAASPRRGGNLTIDTVTPPLDFDIDTTNDNESIWALENMAEGLYRNAADGKSVVPWLATGYKVSSNKLVWTFTLRKGVKFSNGQTMTSKDVAWSLNWAAGPKDVSNNYVDAAIKKVVPDGRYKVKIVTKEPWSPLLADLAMYANDIFPANLAGETRAKFFQAPIGTGPFKVQRWVKGQYLKLSRNPYYWQRGKPYLDSLTMQSVSDSNTRINQLKGGQAQIIEDVPFNLIPSLKQTSGINVGLFKSSRIDYITMNELEKPLSNLHVRLAIAHAIDSAAIVKAVFGGYGQTANSPFMPIMTYYKAVGLPAYSLSAAKSELAKSPYPHGGFTIKFLAASGDPIQTPVAQIVQSELAKLNIHVQIQTLDPSAVQAQEQSFHFGMRETYWTNDIIDPDEYTSFSLCGSGKDCGGIYANFTHFNNAEINRLTLQGERTLAGPARAAIYQKIQKLAAQQVPMVWLGYSPFAYGYSKAVNGFSVTTQGNVHYEDVWLSK